MKVTHLICVTNQQNTKTDSRKSTERTDGGPYSCKTTHIFSGNKSGGKTLIKYDLDDTLEIKQEFIQGPVTIAVQKRNETNESKFCTVYIKEDDALEVNHKPQTMKKQQDQESGQEKKHTCEKCARSYKRKSHLNQHIRYECDVKLQFRYGWPYSYTTTHMPSVNKSGTKTLIKYDLDDTLYIKQKFIQDPETSQTTHEGNKTNESKFYTVYIKEHDVLEVKHRPQTVKKKQIQESEQEKKHTCEKCARSYKRKVHLNQHVRYECDVRLQFRCTFCGKEFKRKGDLSRHVSQIHIKKIFLKLGMKYICEKCSRSYLSLSGLHHHKRVEHAAVKPQFICDFCGYKSNRKTTLINHILKMHL
ncbi:zinc finger protein 595-like [Belonocnema kinseyi]|uniref:zinc finger protein 595-like n=1 Tax=Belonocnema kinseyi TaxID=2817044 RepID=UPI00143DE052|nr:zinc finger protein 595-like [Belonocnema kinseyi]